MRKIKEILRLKFEAGLGYHKIARSCSVSSSTVADIVSRAEKAGLSWITTKKLDDTEIEKKLFPERFKARNSKPEPDWAEIHRELKRKNVTLQLLWEEYKKDNPEGYQYSYFCELYKKWCKTLDVTLRQVHKAGEKMFVDYAGQTFPVVNPNTGESTDAQIFIAVLGASNYTYVEATWDQKLFHWIGAQCRTFEFFDGIPEITVPDNTKTGVKHPCRYEPDLNATYRDMAEHYGTTIIPARPYRPRDKAKVESAVLVVERWILARLRNRIFFSIEELNKAISVELEVLNNRPFQKLEGSRRSLYETLDKPALKPLPKERYEFAWWKKARINIDYHIEVEKNYYSAPYQLVKEEVDVRLTASAVEIIYKGKRVASHPRLSGKGNFNTLMEHRPKAHQKYLEWTPSRIINWAEDTGPSTAQLVKTILENKPHPEQGYRSCLGILGLEKRYSRERLEAASRRALSIGSPSYKSVKSILENGLDQVSVVQKSECCPIQHQNLRGPNYYRQKKVPPC